MKFIRDIIAERSDVKPSEPVETPAEFEAEPAPTSVSRRPDRTMTRLSDGAMLGADDVFKRLLSEGVDAAAEDTDATEPLISMADDVEVDSPQADVDEDDNLFDDLTNDISAADDDMEGDDVVPNLSDPVEDLLSEASGFDEEHSTIEPEPEPEIEFRRHHRSISLPPSDVQPATPAEPEHPKPVEETPTVPDMVAVPAPASGRSGRGAGRVKTRLLGFGMPDAPMHDPFAQEDQPQSSASPQTTFPVGWLVVTAGPGRGTSFALQDGVSQIGRGEDQAIRLDFGDTSISRSNHAAIAYDSEQGGFYLGHGGKANMVRLNDRPVLSTEEITSGAMIRIGETTLRFIAFCDGDFSWAEEGL